MGSDQDDWLRRNTLTPEQKEAERRAFQRSWNRSNAKILAREQEHAIYGTFKSSSSPITVPSMPQREAMGAAAAAAVNDKVRELLEQGQRVSFADFARLHLKSAGVDPDFELKPPAPAAPSDLPTDPELRALVLQIRELAKE